MTERFSTWIKTNCGSITQNDIDAIARGDSVGMVECNIEVLDKFKPRFPEMSPVFNSVKGSREGRYSGRDESFCGRKLSTHQTREDADRQHVW